MKRLGLSGLSFLALCSGAVAQTVQPVLPGQQICNTNSGSTVCNFIPLSTTNPLPVTGTLTATANISVISAPITTTNGTVTTGGTFQVALAGNASRKGCAITNRGTHTQYIYFGATGSATIADSIPIAPGQQITCSMPGNLVVSPDIVNITTDPAYSGDAFVVNSQ